MNHRLFLTTILLLATITSCKKDSSNDDVDLVVDWVGTYYGVAGNNTINRVVVTRVNNTTVKMELQTQVLGTYYTYATIGNAKVSSKTNATINEDGTVYSYSGTYHFSGTATRNGNTLQLNGMATQSGASTLYYVFSGDR